MHTATTTKASLTALAAAAEAMYVVLGRTNKQAWVYVDKYNKMSYSWTECIMKMRKHSSADNWSLQYRHDMDDGSGHFGALYIGTELADGSVDL